jgi:hypothetical protein
MASADLSRRVDEVVGYPPLSAISDLQRREFHAALLNAGAFEDLPGKWQAAILKAEANRPNLRIVGSGAFRRSSSYPRAPTRGAAPLQDDRKALSRGAR